MTGNPNPTYIGTKTSNTIHGHVNHVFMYVCMYFSSHCHRDKTHNPQLTEPRNLFLENVDTYFI